MRRLAIGIALSLGVLACTRLNPAFEEELGEDGDETRGDSAEKGEEHEGDGDGSDGHEGDGDPTTGDGDPTTGDGDPTTGDGDPTTGDGDPTTGDGDPTTGDGDPNGLVCEFPTPLIAYDPATAKAITHVDISHAPGFHNASSCWAMSLCPADQSCEPFDSSVLYWIDSTGDGESGFSQNLPVSLRLSIRPLSLECPDPMLLDSSQWFDVHVSDGGGVEIIKVRLPCTAQKELDLWIGYDGSTFWNSDLTIPAALWI
jgi:hypothetical protein